MMSINYFNKSSFKTYTVEIDNNSDIEQILTGNITMFTLCNDILEKTRSKICSVVLQNFNIIYSTNPSISFCKDMPLLNIVFEEKTCVISNLVEKDPRNTGFDCTSCPIKKFCGIPIIKNNIVYAQLIIANNSKGYSKNTVIRISKEISLLSNIIIAQSENMIFKDTLSTKKNNLEFLSSVTHELYTPIHGIISMISLLSDIGELNAKQKEYVSYALSSCEDLIELVKDTIDFQKIKLGNLAIVNDHFDLRKLVCDLINLVKFKADRKNLYLEYNIDKNIPPTVYGDKIRLSQILLNLIGNAIKFTSKGGVDLIVKQYPSRVIFTIKDTGCGIKKDNLDNIFKDYFQEDKYNKNGLGIGLALSKKLIQMMGGGITVESTVNRGSTFTIDIPLSEERYKTFDDPTNINILIVDEHEHHRILLRQYLFQWKVKVDVAYSFQEARKIMECGDSCQPNIFIINTSNLAESFGFTKWINENYEDAKVISLGTVKDPMFDETILDINDKVQVYNAILSAKNTKKQHIELLHDLSKCKICIVEDDEISSYALHEILLTYGVSTKNITIIDNGEEALRNISHNFYDIIFMDCKLKHEMDGIRATKILKESMPDLVIIGITASVTEEERQDWLNYGLDGYLIKPFKKQMIENILHKYF